MKKILFAPSRIVALGVSSGLLARGSGWIFFEGE